MNSVDHILRRVQKPGRYSGGEWNSIRKNPDDAVVKIALVFPDLYEIGMSYLGQKILYSLLNQKKNWLVERIYAPWSDMEEALTDAPMSLFSLENHIPLNQFDIIGISLLYELNYSNLVTILRRGNVPLLSRERTLTDPLVIGGGPAAFNPEPLAEIMDLFLIGDGEEGFPEIVETYLKEAKGGRNREEQIRILSNVDGTYAPGFYDPVTDSESPLIAVQGRKGFPKTIQKRILHPFENSFFPQNIIVPNISTVFDRVSIEVSRGCPERCRFCQASGIYFPFRIKDPRRVLATMEGSLVSTGYEDASLTSLSVGDYPYLQPLMDRMMDSMEDRRISLSLSSMRPSGLTDKVAETILKVRKTGFTLVPEAGTERLRKVINKNLKEEDLMEAVNTAFAKGWRLLKLYFMVGLPTETEEDLEGIIRTVKNIIQAGYQILGGAPLINLSVSSFVPKPHTPFQWEKMEQAESLHYKHGYLRKSLKKYRFVQFKKTNIRNSVLEAVFSRGDRRLTRVLMDAWDRGVRFDSWDDCFRYDLWEEAFDAQGVDPSAYLQELPEKALLPWDHIDTGIRKAYLKKERRKAWRAERTISCLETECRDCQGCHVESLFQKEFPPIILAVHPDRTEKGEGGKVLLRYRVRYCKTERARYLSHKDMNTILQRGIRRSLIEVGYSQGFHPKMIISHVPALPLGMEGREEIFEFRSPENLDETEFVSRMNLSLPDGISVIGISSCPEDSPGLANAVSSFVYSLNLDDEEVKPHIVNTDKKDIIRSLKRAAQEIYGEDEKRLFKIDAADASSPRKIILEVVYNPQKSIRIQDIVASALNLENPVFALSRERIIMK